MLSSRASPVDPAALGRARGRATVHPRGDEMHAAARRTASSDVASRIGQAGFAHSQRPGRRTREGRARERGKARARLEPEHAAAMGRPADRPAQVGAEIECRHPRGDGDRRSGRRSPRRSVGPTGIAGHAADWVLKPCKSRNQAAHNDLVAGSSRARTTNPHRSLAAARTCAGRSGRTKGRAVPVAAPDGQRYAEDPAQEGVVEDRLRRALRHEPPPRAGPGARSAYSAARLRSCSTTTTARPSSASARGRLHEGELVLEVEARDGLRRENAICAPGSAPRPAES